MFSEFKNPLKSVVVSTGAVYLLLLIGLVSFGSVLFADIYNSRQAGIENEYYRIYLLVVSSILALILGVWSALVGRWQGHILWGILALGAGFLVTLVSVSSLPWIYFSDDQYPVPFMFIYRFGIPVLAVWLVTRFITQRSFQK